MYKTMNRYAWVHTGSDLYLIAFMLPVKGYLSFREVVELTKDGRVYLPCRKEDVAVWNGGDVVNSPRVEHGLEMGGLRRRLPDGLHVYEAVVPAAVLQAAFAKMAAEPAPSKDQRVDLCKVNALASRIRVIKPEFREVEFRPASGTHWGGRSGRLGDPSREPSPWWVD